MTNFQGFKRNPAIRCWITHILKGNYVPEERLLYTIFGKVKRVRILASILKKEEQVFKDNFDEERNELGLKFTLDDGTGVIIALGKDMEKRQLKKAARGDLVDLVGIVTLSEGSHVISPIEIIRKIDNPDYKLLRDAEIIEKIQTIPKAKATGAKKEQGKSDLKEKIYEMIEKYSEGANGISFNELKAQLKITQEELRRIIKDLEIDLRIYPSEEDVYQCF